MDLEDLNPATNRIKHCPTPCIAKNYLSDGENRIKVGLSTLGEVNRYTDAKSNIVLNCV